MMHVNGTYTVKPSPIYSAILAAADFIESHPQTLHFTNGTIPNCYSAGINVRAHYPCCPLAHIGAVLNETGDVWPRLASHRQIPRLLGLAAYHEPDDNRNGDRVFYHRMDQLTPYDWKADPVVCARTLRAYAERYHKPTGLPDSVKGIFEDALVDDKLIPEDA